MKQDTGLQSWCALLPAAKLLHLNLSKCCDVGLVFLVGFFFYCLSSGVASDVSPFHCLGSTIIGLVAAVTK